MGISFDPIAFLERRFEAARNKESLDEYRAIIEELLECVKEFQKETARLEEENKQLKDTKALESEVKNRYKYPIVTRTSDNHKVAYCGSCWGRDKKFIRMGGQSTPRGQFFSCNCKNHFLLKSGGDVFERT